jgi:hypothetical protein
MGLLYCYLLLYRNRESNNVRFYFKICPYTKNIYNNSVNDIIPVGNVGKPVVGSTGTLGLGCGSGMIGG